MFIWFYNYKLRIKKESDEKIFQEIVNQRKLGNSVNIRHNRLEKKIKIVIVKENTKTPILHR